LKLYTEGQAAFDAGDYAKAAGLFKQAVALDTTFAMAWRKLAVSYADGAMSPVLVDSALIKAYQNRDHLTDQERWTTVGSYFQSGPGHDRGKAIEAFAQGVALGDYDVSATNLGNLYVSRRQFAAADSVYQSSIQHRPSTSLLAYIGLARSLSDQGNHRGADSLLDLIDRRFGRRIITVQARGLLLYNQGLVDSSAAYLRTAQESANQIERAQLLEQVAALEELHGRLGDYRRDIASARTIEHEQGVFAPAINDSLQSAYFDAWLRGHSAAAVRKVDSTLAAAPLRTIPIGARPYGDVAVVYAIAGRPDEARAMLAQYDADVRDTTLRRAQEPNRLHALGMIAMADGHPLDAVRNFYASDSFPDGPVNDCAACVDAEVGLAFDRANIPDSAIAHYERYLNTPFAFRLFNDADQVGLIYRRLGELYDAKGDRGDAARYYEKFVNLWKNADPDLQPQVADIKRRLSDLQMTEKKS
ncbi:MAG TPA: tetratricopeptide repeat protein, partial [Gemmatimonadaceae bacterium]|nr:tetratricopeptide repeat protein [Gemmatimonadaceae bacterium]